MSSTRLFQVCFLHLWNCLTHLIWSLFVVQVYQVTHSNVVVFHYPKYTILFFYHGPSVSSHSVRNQYSVHCPPGLNLQSLFQASGGGTLNINPHGTFVLNVQFGNRSQSEYDNCDAFDSLVNFDDF